MAHAVFIKNPNTGCHYRRSIWYSDIEAAKKALDFWLELVASEAILVEDGGEKGEVT
jgi:ureidoglycolate hydrolase